MNESAHVAAERTRQQGLFTAGMNAGVDLERNRLPQWIAAIYAQHGAYDRGLLLGVLLEELARNESPSD